MRQYAKVGRVFPAVLNLESFNETVDKQILHGINESPNGIESKDC